jgi:hypothetical protein
LRVAAVVAAGGDRHGCATGGSIEGATAGGGWAVAVARGERAERPCSARGDRARWDGGVRWLLWRACETAEFDARGDRRVDLASVLGDC